VAYSAVKIASPSFYALRDARTPLFVSVAAVITNIVLNLTLVHVIGFRGLALGTAVAATLNAGLLLWILRGRLGGIEAARTTRTLAACLAASAVMGLAAWLVESGLEILLPGSRTIVRAIRVFSAIAVGALTFAVVARAFGVEEVDDLIRRVLRKPEPASHV
jgi:putative peptidoglycan lipid II flippase